MNAESRYELETIGDFSVCTHVHSRPTRHIYNIIRSGNTEECDSRYV
jgi:hypothetical protein